MIVFITIIAIFIFSKSNEVLINSTSNGLTDEQGLKNDTYKIKLHQITSQDSLPDKVNKFPKKNLNKEAIRKQDSIKKVALLAHLKDSIRKDSFAKDSVNRFLRVRAKIDSINKEMVEESRPISSLVDKILLTIANKFYPEKLATVIKVAVERRSNNDILVLTLFLFIHFFIINFILISGISILILILKTIKEKKIKYYSEIYQNTLAEYIFYEGASSDLPEELKQLKDNKFKRAVLIDELIKFNKNLYGEARDRLRELYLEMNLDKDSIKNVNSNRWYIQAKGFRQLAQMNVTDANSLIDKNLNSTNDILSFEAQLAMVQLNHESPFSFLDKLKKYFPLWNQLNVQILINNNNIKVPEFSKWLNSDNEYVITFALRMVRIFQQQNAFNSIVLLLKHPNDIVRKNAIITLGNLGLNEGLIHLRNIFSEQETSTKIIILKAMQTLPDESNIKFLGDLLQDTDNDIKFEAGKALITLGEIGKNRLILARMETDVENIEILSIIDHLLDKKIL